MKKTTFIFYSPKERGRERECGTEKRKTVESERRVEVRCYLLTKRITVEIMRMNLFSANFPPLKLGFLIPFRDDNLWNYGWGTISGETGNSSGTLNFRRIFKRFTLDCMPLRHYPPTRIQYCERCANSSALNDCRAMISYSRELKEFVTRISVVKCTLSPTFFFFLSTGEFAACWYILISGAVFLDGSMFLPGSR